MDSEASATEALRHVLDRATTSVKETFNQRLNALYSTVLASPGTILTLFIVISSVFAVQGMAFQEQIDGDVEIFLPDGASSTDLLLEVRTEWSTDLAVIYITTPNARNPNDTTNITDEVVLNEISWLEGTIATSEVTQPAEEWISIKMTTDETTVSCGLSRRPKS